MMDFSQNQIAILFQLSSLMLNYYPSDLKLSYESGWMKEWRERKRGNIEELDFEVKNLEEEKNIL